MADDPTLAWLVLSVSTVAERCCRAIGSPQVPLIANSNHIPATALRAALHLCQPLASDPSEDFPGVVAQ